jgi:Na+-driven multidrug efflux pump
VIALALVVHLVLAFIWIPTAGAVGAARSALISQVLAGLTLMYLVHQRNGLKQPYPSYLVVIFTSLLIWFFA